MGDLISVVIPCYNEERRISASLVEILTFCRNHFDRYEIICVDDGSTARTPEMLEDARRHSSSLRTVSLGTNRGKGRAVREGMKDAKGAYRFFTDADLPYGTGCFLSALAVFKDTGCDMVAGARNVSTPTDGVERGWIRSVISRIFSATVERLLALDVEDSQCGLKGFSRGCAETLFSHALVDGYAFDVELFILARGFGHTIQKVPVTLLKKRHSKVRLLYDPFAMLIDLFRLSMRSRRGRLK